MDRDRGAIFPESISHCCETEVRPPALGSYLMSYCGCLYRYVQRFGKDVDDADDGDDDPERARRSTNPQLLWQVRDHTQHGSIPSSLDNELASTGEDGTTSLWTNYPPQPLSLPPYSPGPPSASPLDALGQELPAGIPSYLLALDIASPPSLPELPGPQLLGMGHVYRGLSAECDDQVRLR